MKAKKRPHPHPIWTFFDTCSFNGECVWVVPYKWPGVFFVYLCSIRILASVAFRVAQIKISDSTGCFIWMFDTCFKNGCSTKMVHIWPNVGKAKYVWEAVILYNFQTFVYIFQLFVYNFSNKLPVKCILVLRIRGQIYAVPVLQLFAFRIFNQNTLFWPITKNYYILNLAYLNDVLFTYKIRWSGQLCRAFWVVGG